MLWLATAFIATVGISGLSPAHASTAHSVSITLTPGTVIGLDAGCNNTTNISTTAQVIYARPGDTIAVTWTGFDVIGIEKCAISISSVSGTDMTQWSFTDGIVTISMNSSSTFTFTERTGILTFTVGTVETNFRVNRRTFDSLVFNYERILSVVLGDPPSTSSESRPIMTTLTMSYGDGEACTPTSIAGVRGQWVDLPPADTCSTSSRSSSAALLGWATQPDFPATIAQRQIDNGWGAYETFDPAGQLTGVFIPAGGATVLSNDNVLHAIWSN